MRPTGEAETGGGEGDDVAQALVLVLGVVVLHDSRTTALR
jgi:hypothetical protein